MNPVLDFLQDIIKLLTLQSKMGSDKEEEVITNSKDAYKWLMDQMKDSRNTRVQINKDPGFQSGKIYIFKYNAKNKSTLDYWDKHPIVLCVGMINTSKGKLMIGLNISWYPPSARKYIVEKIRLMYKSSYSSAIKAKSLRANEQHSVSLDLYNLQTALDQVGLSFALRQYIPSLIISPKVCVCYEDWDKAVKLDQPRIFPELMINASGTSLSSIYEDYKKYIEYQRNNRGDIKASRDIAKKNNKFKFVK